MPSLISGGHLIGESLALRQFDRATAFPARIFCEALNFACADSPVQTRLQADYFTAPAGKDAEHRGILDR